MTTENDLASSGGLEQSKRGMRRDELERKHENSDRENEREIQIRNSKSNLQHNFNLDQYFS